MAGVCKGNEEVLTYDLFNTVLLVIYRLSLIYIAEKCPLLFIPS